MGPLLATVSPGGLLAAGLVLGLFALVAWICRRRQRVRDPRLVALESSLVELTQTQSAAEADRLAALLRARGLVAIANAEEMPPVARSARDVELLGVPLGAPERRYRTFVVVRAADLDRARQVLGAKRHPREAPRKPASGRVVTQGRSEGDPNGSSGPPLRVDTFLLWVVRVCLLLFVVALLCSVVHSFL